MSQYLLLTAGIFQWTPFKRACLKSPRSPLSFLMSQWRDGAAGSFFMGLRHGAYCVGCCWALMASRLSSEDLVQYIVATSLAGIVPN